MAVFHVMHSGHRIIEKGEDADKGDLVKIRLSNDKRALGQMRSWRTSLLLRITLNPGLWLLSCRNMGFKRF